MNTIPFRRLQRLNSDEIKKQLPLEVTVRGDNGKIVEFVIRKPVKGN